MPPLSELVAVLECFLSSFVSGLYDMFLVAAWIGDLSPVPSFKLGKTQESLEYSGMRKR